jgi:hypothetical protein
MKIREEKLKQNASIPKKLEDGWESIIDMHVNGFDCVDGFCVARTWGTTRRTQRFERRGLNV